jgi:hypothetical protein
MAESHFTRATWRPGAKRQTYPRVRDWGGQVEASAEFLAWSGSVAGFGSGRHRRCARPGCNGWAMREASECRKHNGASVASKLRPYASPWRARQAAYHSPAPETFP